MFKLFLCIPVINAVNTIDRTIESILKQDFKYKIRFHVQDCNSSDGTIDRLRYWSSTLQSHDSIVFSYKSEADDGMYDAICRSFEMSDAKQAEWLTWINADDYFTFDAFRSLDIVDNISTIRIRWFSGMASVQSIDGTTTQSRRPITKEILELGLADGVRWEFVQQEGTFFRRNLWDKNIDKKRFKQMKFAGDWYLWYQFAKTSDIYFLADKSLGVFCLGENQLSSDISKYHDEISTVLSEKDRTEAMKKKMGISSKVKYLYPTDRGTYLREEPIAGHYNFRFNNYFS